MESLLGKRNRLITHLSALIRRSTNRADVHVEPHSLGTQTRPLEFASPTFEAFFLKCTAKPRHASAILYWHGQMWLIIPSEESAITVHEAKAGWSVQTGLRSPKLLQRPMFIPSRNTVRIASLASRRFLPCRWHPMQLVRDSSR